MARETFRKQESLPRSQISHTLSLLHSGPCAYDPLPFHFAGLITPTLTGLQFYWVPYSTGHVPSAIRLTNPLVFIHFQSLSS